MIRTKEEYVCDICGETVDKDDYNSFKLHVRRYHDGTDGRCAYNPPIITTVLAGICFECALKAIPLVDDGVQCVQLKLQPLNYVAASMYAKKRASEKL
jgi:hypothetical protein